MARTTAFRPWVTTLDPNQFAALRGRGSWLIVLSVTMAGTLLASFVPPASDVMGMQITPVAVCWLVMCGNAALISSDVVTRSLGQIGMGILMLTTSASIQLFFWSWVCFSSEFGSVMLLAFATLIAAYHGEFFQANFAHPWGFMPTLFAVISALVMAPTAHHLAVVIGGGLITIGAVYAMGNIGYTRNRTVQERDSLRAAVDAQVLADRGLEIERTRRALNELRGRNHDAANALAVMFGSVDLIGHYLDEMRGDPQMASQLRDSSVKLKSALDRLSGIVLESSEIGQEAAGEPIDPVTVAREVLREHRPLFPRVDMELETDTQNGPTLNVPGGAGIGPSAFGGLLFVLAAFAASITMSAARIERSRPVAKACSS